MVPDAPARRWRGSPRAWPVLQGILPIERSRVPAEVLAGLTLAALGVPAVLGYAKIAGMPLVTGLYTMLLPMAVYAILGSSRHLVVAADSATAVILAAALTGLAVTGSERYVRLAGLAALLTGGMLVAALPRGLPRLGLPALGWHDATALLGAAVAMFVVILAQSAATSRAYAAKYEEPFSEATDLTGLAAANAAAAFTGTFVVNGSPTKAQIVDSAGGRSQLSPLTAAAVVLVVLVVLTGPLAALPVAALAAVVFLIAVALIHVARMRRILATRRHEFAVALLTTVAVVGLGVEYGIVVAIIASIVDHLRHSYNPLNSVLVKSPEGHWHAVPVGPGARTAPGLVVYRFGTSLYYANAAKLAGDIAMLAGHGAPLRWLVLDFAAID